MCRAGISLGNNLLKKNEVYSQHMVENGGRKRGRQCMDGLFLLPKLLLGRLLHVTVWRLEGGGMSDLFFGGRSAEIGAWIEECWEHGGCEKCVQGE